MRIIYGITIIIYCMLVIILHTLLYIKNKSKQGRKGKSANGTEEREEQGKGCRRHPRQFLASLPFRLLPHRPHHRQRLTLSPSPRRTSNQSERKGGHLVRFWAMPSPPPRHRPDSNQQRDGASNCLPSCRPSPPCRGAWA